MKHCLVAEGFGIRHRPVCLGDAPFLVWLRNREHAKGKLGDSAMDTPSQENWLNEYFKREGDYYFIIETTCGIPVGAIGYYNMTEDSSEIGRWVIWPAVPAAVPSLPPIIDLGFQRLGLRELRAKVVSDNRRAINLYYKIGFKATKVEPSAQIIDGKKVDLLHIVLEENAWIEARKKLTPIAAMLEVQIRKWEQDAARNPLPWTVL